MIYKQTNYLYGVRRNEEIKIIYKKTKDFLYIHFDENKNLKLKDNMKNEMTITPPEGFEVDKEKSTFEKIVFKKIECKYPKSVKEIEGRDWYIGSCGGLSEMESKDINQVSTKEKAEGLLALTQLIELRDACNEIDRDTGSCVYYNIDKLGKGDKLNLGTSKLDLLYFYKESTRDWFYNEHKQLIEQYFKLF